MRVAISSCIVRVACITKVCACLLQASSPLSLHHLTCTTPAWSLTHLQASAESTPGQSPADNDTPTTSAVSCDTTLQPNGRASLFFYLHPSPSQSQASGQSLGGQCLWEQCLWDQCLGDQCLWDQCLGINVFGINVFGINVCSVFAVGLHLQQCAWKTVANASEHPLSG